MVTFSTLYLKRFFKKTKQVKSTNDRTNCAQPIYCSLRVIRCRMIYNLSKLEIILKIITIYSHYICQHCDNEIFTQDLWYTTNPSLNITNLIIFS